MDLEVFKVLRVRNSILRCQAPWLGEGLDQNEAWIGRIFVTVLSLCLSL